MRKVPTVNLRLIYVNATHFFLFLSKYVNRERARISVDVRNARAQARKFRGAHACLKKIPRSGRVVFLTNGWVKPRLSCAAIFQDRLDDNQDRSRATLESTCPSACLQMTLRKWGCENLPPLHLCALLRSSVLSRYIRMPQGTSRAKALQSLFASLIERLKNVGEFYDGIFLLANANGFM